MKSADHQEVAGVALAADDLGLVLRAAADLVADAARVAPGQPELDLLDEPGLLGLPRRAREPRHVAALALGEGHVAALGDQQRVVAGLGQLAPHPAHLLRRLQVVVVALELEPLGVGHRRAGLDAQQHLVGRRVLLVRVVQVVGGDERQVEVLGQPEQVGADPGLDLQAVLHQLEVVVAGPEDVAELRRSRARLVVLAEPQEGLHLAGRAAGGGDQPARVGLQQLAVHPGLVEEALEAGPAVEAEQVVHAGGGLGQQRHVGERATAGHVVPAALAPLDPGAVAAVGARRDVGLDADDRLDPGGGGLLPEVVGAEDVAVVGHRQGRHGHLAGGGEQVVQPGGAVEHGVLGVRVQVHERVAGSHAGRCLRVLPSSGVNGPESRSARPTDPASPRRTSSTLGVSPRDQDRVPLRRPATTRRLDRGVPR